MNWEKVDEALFDASVFYTEGQNLGVVKKKFVFPGAVLLAGKGGEVVYLKAFGCRSLIPTVTPMHEDVVFDLASLSKVFVTTTLLMQLVEAGKIDVKHRVSRLLQTFGSQGKESITIRHLLTHSSGLASTQPFYKEIEEANCSGRMGIMASRGAVQLVNNALSHTKLEYPVGSATKYSDLGFLVLGAAIEAINGSKHLDRLAQENIFTPLKLQSTGYIDLSRIRKRDLGIRNEVIAPTAQCPWRGRVLCGEVHDDNAWAMGGVAGHAGVFSTARDVHLFASELINCYHNRGSLVSPEVLRQFWQRDGSVPNSTWALGWDTPSKQGSSSGQHFSANSVGHLGFTGCSLWIDPEREIDVILLSNRIHPSIDNQAIRDFRPVIHDLVMEALGLC